jgi:hypothetical protein
MNRIINKLIGKWITASGDDKAYENYGKVTLEFLEDANLIYTIHEKEKDQKIFLTYRVQDNYLITNQPLKPQEEKTRFELISNRYLVLFYGGIESRYSRMKWGTAPY